MFIGSTFLAITFMGGVYAVLPAYEADLFGEPLTLARGSPRLADDARTEVRAMLPIWTVSAHGCVVGICSIALPLVGSRLGRSNGAENFEVALLKDPRSWVCTTHNNPS